MSGNCNLRMIQELGRTMEEAHTTAFWRLRETGELETQEGRGDTRRNTGEVSPSTFPKTSRKCIITMEEAHTTAFWRLGEMGELETQEGRGDTRRNTEPDRTDNLRELLDSHAWRDRPSLSKDNQSPPPAKQPLIL
ncbi:hypothetical protein G5714_010289 [Onychostoma macrolepis]|uniref:Uncharacterized protein n=1 Tax=Onychostoma macrolepis TaxID=369639 RepID=A0A7J6CPT0_9TELE|nr:hypothetical protein G5714_010289 [Onychostoma macrolepis]